MALTQLTETDLAETVQRAQEIAVQGREPAVPEAAFEDYVKAAEEMGIPREAMIQALRERLLVPGESFEEGQVVFAPSADGHWYAGKIVRLAEHTVTVSFLEGGEHTCALADLRPLSLIPGRKLEADIKDWGWYRCIIVKYDQEKKKVQVIHDDWAPLKEWLPLHKLRLTKKHVSPEPVHEEAAAAKKARAALIRYATLFGGFGIIAGAMLHHFLPFLFPFLR